MERGGGVLGCGGESKIIFWESRSTGYFAYRKIHKHAHGETHKHDYGDNHKHAYEAPTNMCMIISCACS